MRIAASGFTLIELLVTVAMMVIVLTLGVPSFKELIQNNRLTAATNELVTALNLARSEAIKRGRRVTVCKSADGSTCTNSGDWKQGWIVFTDLDGDGSLEDDGDSTPCEQNEDDDCLLRVYPPVDSDIDITNSRKRITFAADGTAWGFNGTFTFCDGRGTNHVRGIVVSATGRVRMAVDGSDADKIPEDGSGNNLSCSS